MVLSILHTNDLHGKLSAEKLPFLLSARKSVDLYFDSGDAVKTGNLGIPLRQEDVWDRLAEADCSASVPGNRESHILAASWAAKIKGHQHALLCANMRDRRGALVLPPSMILDGEDLKIGVLGVMIPMVTPTMTTQAASAYLWDPPIAAAVAEAKKLRRQVDLVIALTHIGYLQDEKLALECPDIDIILGGHSHSVLQEPVKINNSWIAQGGSHARFLGLYDWDSDTRVLQGGLTPWPDR